MPELIPVEHDPFAQQAAPTAAPQLIPVDHDPFAAPVSKGSDIAQSIPAGLSAGASGLLGLPRDISRFLDWGPSYAIAKGAEKLGLLPNGKTAEDFQKAADALNLPQEAHLPGSSEIQSAAQKIVPALGYEPKTTEGKYAKTISSFIPGAAIAPGSTLKNIATLGVVPGAASEAAGQLAEGSGYEPAARIAGAVAGSIAPGLLSRVVTPLPASPARRALLDTMDKEGIDLTAGQRSGSKPLQWAESTLGDMPGAGGKAAAIQERQGQQFTSAALKRMGIADDGALATPETLKSGKQAIGTKFEDLASRNTVTFDPKFGQDLGKVVKQYDSLLPAGQQSSIVQDTIADIATQGNQMPGTMYQALRSQIDKQARGVAQSNPPLSEALFGIRNALDSAMSRSISGPDAFEWAKARGEWKNWKAIEKAATGAGAASAEGYISPQQLRSAVVNQNRGAYATGQGDLADLARAGAGTMAPLPNSGTAPRQNIQHLIQMMSGGGGMAAGGGMGAVAGLLAPSIAGRTLMSGPVQSWLGNQIMPRIGLLSQMPADQRQLGLLMAASPALTRQ